MRKILAVALFLLAGLLCACGSDPVEESSFPRASDPVTKTIYVHTEITQTYGDTTTRTRYLYDAQDCLTQVVISTNDTESLRYQVTCDENGNPLRWETTMEGKASVIEYTYDEQGQVLGTYAYTEGKLMTATEYTWGNGLRVSVTAKAPSQNYERRTEYTYDENHTLFREDLYTNGELSAYTICTCDSEGTLTESRTYNLEGELQSIVTYTYDGGKETRTTTDADSNLLRTQELTYDDHGNLLSSAIYDQNRELLAQETHIWMPIAVDPATPRASI